VVVQIKNVSRYLVRENEKEFADDLKPVYTAANKVLVCSSLEQIESKLGKKIPMPFS
jgi:hypothetical protein